MRGAVDVLEHADLLQRLGDPLVELVAAQPEVAGAEGDVVADPRHEQLVVGVLEDDPDPAADLQQVALLDGQARDRHRARRRRAAAR